VSNMRGNWGKEGSATQPRAKGRLQKKKKVGPGGSSPGKKRENAKGTKVEKERKSDHIMRTREAIKRAVFWGRRRGGKTQTLKEYSVSPSRRKKIEKQGPARGTVRNVGQRKGPNRLKKEISPERRGKKAQRLPKGTRPL